MNRHAGRTATKLPRPKAARLSRADASVFAAAVHHHQAGRLSAAEQLYRQVLATNPNHADSWHLLGVLALQSGRADVASDLIGTAIGLDATVALYHLNLGNAVRTLGRLDQAIACYRRAIVLRPRYQEACNNLGATLHAHDQPSEAETWLRKAIALAPDFADAHNNLGNVLAGRGRHEEATACFRRAVALRPDYAEAHNNLGTTLKDRGAWEDAAACYRQALSLQPDLAATHSNLGIVLAKLGRLEAAIQSCRQAIALQPGLLEAHDALGAALADHGALDEAAACYQAALARWPDEPRLHDDMGTVRKEQGHVAEAIGCFRTAIALRPDLANAHRNLAMALLARGEMAEGWREYEWRWQTAAMAAARRDFPQPQWRGEAAEGLTLLLHAEQGLGDTLQFCRYAALAAARGLRVVMAVQPPLLRLLRGMAGVERVVALGQDPGPFDLHCPMQSMPLAMGTTLATIPNAPAYLHADAAQVAAWGARLAALGGNGPRVGVAWAGDKAMVRDRHRSLAPAQLAPLLAVRGVRFFSLQKDQAAAGLTDFMPEMADFADTAALVANLDLVIAVDTAVAHLAAALGKPVWLLDRFDPDWRWLLGRRDSPWYPSLRLYRQPRPGDWAPVLADVARDLAEVAAAASPTRSAAAQVSPLAAVMSQ